MQVYDLPYQESEAASAAISKTMEACDWKAPLTRLDNEFCGWKVPSAVLYGNAVRPPPSVSVTARHV